MKKTAAQFIEVTIETPTGINSQTGKSEEIEILSRIINRFKGTQTYLSMLFTDSLIDWFGGRVHDDFGTDLFMEYQAEIETSRNQSTKLNKLSAEADALQSQIDYNKENARAILAGKDNMINSLTDKVAELNRIINTERYEAELAGQERDTLAATVTSLKVMLFDLQNKKTA